jgi:UDP-N-acetylmuramyl pentapeptide synthase
VRLADDAALRAGLLAAEVNRSRLSKVAFVGVTGSAGKTTTKELIAAILAHAGDTIRTPGNDNLLRTVVRTVRHTRRSDDFCVLEVAASWPGTVAQAARVIRPHIAVVTTVGFDHRAMFPTLEAVAREKRALVTSLAVGGVAVLNVDDPYVAGMAAHTNCHVLTFGRARSADVRAEQVTARWPDSLSFVLHAAGETHRVRTRLHGEHQLSSVLAALAAALAAGVPVATAVSAVAEVEPYPGRMSVSACRGVTFLRDDYKAPAWSLPDPLAFLAAARARRRIAVIGTVSNHDGSIEDAYASVLADARRAADEVVLVGEDAAAGARAEEGVRVFRYVRDAAAHLEATAREGDLVLLKGSNRTDHLVRLALHRAGAIACWRESCRLTTSCEACALREQRAGPDTPMPATAPAAARVERLLASGRALLASQDRTWEWWRLDALDPRLVAGVVLAEDRYFWRHPGIDFSAVRAAIRVNWRRRDQSLGASTIAMQVGRLLHRWQGRTYARKTKEAAFALWSVARYDRATLLELYLNLAPFAAGTRGVGAASRTLFGSPPDQLSLFQATLLACVLTDPEIPPGSTPGFVAWLRARQSFLVERLAATGVIDGHERTIGLEEISAAWGAAGPQPRADAGAAVAS